MKTWWLCAGNVACLISIALWANSKPCGESFIIGMLCLNLSSSLRNGELLQGLAKKEG